MVARQILAAFSCTALLAASPLIPATAAPVTEDAEWSWSAVVAEDQDGRVDLVAVGESLAEYGDGDVVPYSALEGANVRPVEASPTAPPINMMDTREFESLAAAAPNDIIDSWYDPRGALINIRAGAWNPNTGAGWGWRKMNYKHDLSTASAKVITTKYFERIGQGSAIRYRATLKHIVCLHTSGCVVEQTVTARAIIEFKNWDGKTQGLLTAYCEGWDGPCPYWARDAR